jgi:hypothetical protein
MASARKKLPWGLVTSHSDGNFNPRAAGLLFAPIPNLKLAPLLDHEILRQLGLGIFAGGLHTRREPPRRTALTAARAVEPRLGRAAQTQRLSLQRQYRIVSGL